MALTTPESIIANWEFFLEGLSQLNNPQGARGDVNHEAFLKLTLAVADKGLDFGLVALLTSCNDKPLGFGIMYENTEPFCERSAIVYAVYSNKKCPTATSELLAHGEEWARKHGIKHLHACSRSFSGARFRLFEKHWHFRRTCVVFTKPL